MTKFENIDKANPILFVDLETTGLSAQEDVPLEIACILTDGLGSMISSYQTLIFEDWDEFKEPVNNIIDHDIEPVYSMHRESGLWNDLFDEHVIDETRGQAEVEIVEWLKTYGVEPKTLPIAGLSIGSLDRPFIQHHFPKLNEFLSHRNIDMSSIREICKRVNPDLQMKIESLLEGQIEVTHRAHDDCEYAIALYMAYIANFFRTGVF